MRARAGPTVSPTVLEQPGEVINLGHTEETFAELDPASRVEGGTYSWTPSSWPTEQNNKNTQEGAATLIGGHGPW